MDSTRPYLFAPSQRSPELPLFVFLPGMDGTGELLRTQTASLERYFDVRCLALPQAEFDSWEELGARVVEAIAAQRQGRPVYLCGESFGGCLALTVAALAPELFVRGILANPASSFRRRPYLGWGAFGTRWMPESIYKASTGLLLPFLAAMDRVEPDARAALVAAMRSVPPETVQWRLSLLDAFEAKPEHLQRLQFPVLLLAGGRDRLLPSVEEAEHLAGLLPEAETVLLPESGHACLLEADVRLSEILSEHDFLDPASGRVASESG